MTTKPTGEPLTPARPLTTARAEGAWTVASALPKGLDPVLLYESAANVLRGGEPNPDGSVSYQGSSYVIEPRFDGSSWTAKLRGTT